MVNYNLKQLLNEYEKKRLKAVADAEARKLALYLQIPRLQQIDDELSKYAISTAKSLLDFNNPNLLTELKLKIQELKKEKLKILHSLQKEDSYLLPSYECSFCKDTGYITTDMYESKMCHCLKQRLFNLEYNKSNLGNIENQNFDNFLSTLYSSQVDQSNVSPRQNIESIKKASEMFIQKFDDPIEKNLLFTGNTGLGKTFLSTCIANELLKKGKTVLYQTAPVMLDMILDYRFGKTTISPALYSSLLNVDLLIIDDLGTENINSMKSTELFNIINTRLLNQNHHVTKTIISTNLSVKSLYAAYDERIVSRFIGHYNIYYFFGEDIRRKKRDA